LRPGSTPGARESSERLRRRAPAAQAEHRTTPTPPREFERAPPAASNMATGIEAWNTSELLAACCGSTIKVWSPMQPDQRREVKLAEGAATNALDWSGNNKVLAVAGDKAQITMVGGGKVIGYVPEAPEPNLGGILALKFSGDSKKLAIGCGNRLLHIRDLRSQVGGSDGCLGARVVWRALSYAVCLGRGVADSCRLITAAAEMSSTRTLSVCVLDCPTGRRQQVHH
jgi:hypothetical protein